MSRIDFSRVVMAERLRADLVHSARATAEARLLAMIEAETQVLSGAVPLAEKLMWATKEEAARACLAGQADAGQSALLEAEAAMTGEAVDALAARILAKAEAMQAHVSRLVGIRRRVVAALAEAGDPEAMEEALAEGRALMEGRAA